MIEMDCDVLVVGSGGSGAALLDKAGLKGGGS